MENFKAVFFNISRDVYSEIDNAYATFGADGVSTFIRNKVDAETKASEINAKISPNGEIYKQWDNAKDNESNHRGQSWIDWTKKYKSVFDNEW